MLYAIERMWCCLSPIEREVTLVVRIAIQIPPYYITETDFNALWALNDPINSELRRQAYINGYQLDTTEVETSEDVFETVYILGGSWWYALDVFEVTHGYACSEPCGYLTFPPVA